MGTPFTGYVWLAYCASPICSNQTNFAKVGTANVKQGGANAFSSGTSITSTSSTSSKSSSTTSTTSSTTTTTIGTTFDPTDGYSGGNNIVFDSSCGSCTLTGNILTTASITINGGVTLTADGYALIAGGNFINSGTINAGLIPNSGGAGQSGGGTGGVGASFSSSYAGSGGGGGGWGSCPSNGCGGAGGNTQVYGGAGTAGGGGSGSTPIAPTITNALINTWYTGGSLHIYPAAAGFK